MYQFIHVETYSKVSAKKKIEKNYNKETKGRNVSEIIAEATRKQDYCDHVAIVRTPEPPILLYGVEPEKLIELTDDYFNNTKLTNANGVVRGLRKDSHVLLAGIISLNREVEDIWDDYKKDAINWLKEKYGHKLKCVIEHTDEENPHIHFYCVQDNGVSFDLLHDGKKAFSEVGGKLKYKKEIAFKNAMREFQDEFYNNVSLKYGLMRTGPRRGRYSNQEYKARKNQIDLINSYKRKIDKESQEKIIRSNNEVKKINSIIDKAKKEAFNFVIDDFNNKNLLNKTITSITFNKNKIKNHDRLLSSNDFLNRKLKFTENRKNIYKDRFKKEQEKNNKLNSENEYYKEINNFLEFDLIDNKENKNDTRRTIIKEVERFEDELQQYNRAIQSFSRKQQKTRFRFAEIGGKLNRIRDILFSNFKYAIGDLFSINSFERKFKEKRNEKIKQIEKIENQIRFTRTSPEYDIKPKI
ncbi:plasmid recombination protein [Providencia hangzhouensis]|uniref:plasmid recombination protein n=1 Tax=Providencia hangzhouensis TaxID=3031799 RepID=UPI0034DDB5F4